MTDSAHRQVLNVSGMTCGHCRAAVESAIREVPGVTGVHVDLDRATATVDGGADLPTLLSAVEEAGYEATPAAGK